MTRTTRIDELRTRLVVAATRTECRGLPLGAGRSLLALAQLATLVFSPDTALFAEALHPPDGMRCTGLRALSLWCAAQTTGHGTTVGRVVAISVLLVVLSGYRPKLTCIPHWYVAFGMAAAMPAANGGDRVLQVSTMLLIPLCLGDDRVWQWTRPDTPLPPVWRGAAFAAWHVLRVQLSAIYLSAVATKLADPLWRQGSAIYVVAHDPVAGFPRPVLDLLEPALRSYWTVAAASWLVIGAQVVIAVLIWGGVRSRRCALVLGVGLHAGIVFLMSLPAFGLAMIGVLVIVSATSRRIEEEEWNSDDGNRRARAVPS